MATKVQGKDGKAPPGAAVNLIAGGGAGMMEALVCHPLGTYAKGLFLADHNKTCANIILSPYNRHDQGPYATLPPRPDARNS